MAGTDDLRNMVMTFRVSELQMLLGFAGRLKTGRKNELQTRSLELLRLKSTPIQMKIRELYKSIQQGVAHGQQMGEAGIPPSPAAMLSQSHKNNMMGHPPGLAYPPQYQPQQEGRTLIYPAYYMDKTPTPPLVDPVRGTAARGTMPNNLPVHPDVQLKRLPFYDHISELLKPSTLMPVGTTRIQEQSFVFHLTPAQSNEIAFNRDVCSEKTDYVTQDEPITVEADTPFTHQAVKGNRKRKRLVTDEGNVEVQMRFCLLETSCEQEDCFPPGLIVQVNSKPCALPSPIPTNRQGVEPKRPPRPVNISHMVRISPTIANTIIVSWAAEYGRGYVIAINLVRKLSSQELLRRLKSRGVRPADYTTGLIKEKLTEDADSEIATTSLRVSLACPLSQTRMTLPCRPTTCSHLQCFDASYYLQMNEKKSTWICPVCNKPGLFDKLVIDGYFQEVLGSNKLPPDVREIQLLQDGSWSFSETKKQEKSESASSQAVKHRGGPPVVAATVEIIDDDIVPVDGSDSEENKEDAKGTDEMAKKAPKLTTVDLTFSSDDDDDDVTPTPVASTNGLDTKKAAVEESSNSNSITTPTPATPGYVSPNIITLDSPSPSTSPELPSTPVPPITYPSIPTLPPFFNLDNDDPNNYESL